MKPNIFTLSLFITPHHTLLLIPAHNPPPRSFTPAPHNPAHYLATITPYTSLLPPLLLATITPTTLLLLPLLLATPTPLPCNPSPTITHYAIPAPCNSHPLPHNPNSLHFTTRHLHTTALYLHLANPTPTPYSPQSQPFPCFPPCSSQPSLPTLSCSPPCSSQPHTRPFPAPLTSLQLYTHPLQPSKSTISLLSPPPCKLHSQSITIRPHPLQPSLPTLSLLPPLLIATLTHYLTTPHSQQLNTRHLLIATINPTLVYPHKQEEKPTRKSTEKGSDKKPL